MVMVGVCAAGDSGFLVVRQGEVVHRSHEQQHYFNTPFQLSLPPAELRSEVSGRVVHPEGFISDPNIPPFRSVSSYRAPTGPYFLVDD
jgi:hypothetical protein